MSAPLSPEQVAAYHRDGYLFPLKLFDEAEVFAFREELEAIEARVGLGALPHGVGQYLRINSHLVIPKVTEFAFQPQLLDVVSSILGPNVMLWSAEFFIKEAHTPKIVSWHQDLTYWGLGETDEELTAWLALSPATLESGCMRFVAGSHKNRILPHRDTFADDNLLSRGQEVAVDVEEEEATNVILQPGEVSLHHGRIFHSSGPNSSSDRRIGLAMRFVTPAVRQIVAERDYAILARGVDCHGNWVHVAPPDQLFAPEALELYDEVLRVQSNAMAENSAQPLEFYSNCIS